MAQVEKRASSVPATFEWEYAPAPEARDIVDIRERERFEHLLSPVWEFETGPAAWAAASSGWSQPIVSVELLSIVCAIAKSVASARRAHAVDEAREEVRREIANYCLAQPNGGAGHQICATSPAIR